MEVRDNLVDIIKNRRSNGGVKPGLDIAGFIVDCVDGFCYVCRAGVLPC